MPKRDQRDLAAAEELTVWAVQFRYEDVLDARLARKATVELVMAIREWARQIVDGVPIDDHRDRSR